MPEKTLLESMRDRIDLQLRQAVDHPLVRPLPAFKSILDYQMGWEDGGETSFRGKRLRPLIVLLSALAACGEWEDALPAAAAVELLHNFTLIHDDIQDKSPTRRGKATVWIKWGVAQAINAGDCMLGLAQLALLEGGKRYQTEQALAIADLFNSTLVELTCGQYLDLAYEDQSAIPMEQYQSMVDGKTGALISASMQIGAIIGGAKPSEIDQMAEFGRKVGRAFQIQDDWLGIWGTDELTGKSAKTDLVERKKSFPIVLGIKANGFFSSEWERLEKIESEDAAYLAELLEKEGIKQQTELAFANEYANALALFDKVNFTDEHKMPLGQLVRSILMRIK